MSKATNLNSAKRQNESNILTQQEYIKEFDQILKSNMTIAIKETSLIEKKFSPNMSLKEATKSYMDILDLCKTYCYSGWSLMTMNSKMLPNDVLSKVNGIYTIREIPPYKFLKDNNPELDIDTHNTYYKVRESFALEYNPHNKTSSLFSKLCKFMFNDQLSRDEASREREYELHEYRFKELFDVENENAIGNKAYEQLIEKFVRIDSGLHAIETYGYEILGSNDPMFE